MIYTVTSTLPAIHGGRTKSLLARIKFLEEHLNEQSTIITTNYNPHYLYVYDELKERGLISDNVVIENIYDWLSGNQLLEEPKVSTWFKKDVKTTKINMPRMEVKLKNNVARYYKNDQYFIYRRFYHDKKVVEFEDYMSQFSKRKLERRQYTEKGTLHRIINFSPITYYKIYEEYYDKKGNIYLKKYFSDSKENALLYISLFKDNHPYQFFKTERELFTYYYNHFFEDGNVVFCDARLLDRALSECNKSLKRVLVFHSTHFVGDKTRGSYKYALNNSEKFEKMITLTDYQKEDIHSEFDIEDNKIKVIPHFVDKINDNEGLTKKDQFCYVGRIADEKQIDHILQAYSQFKNKGYSTKLKIYGKDNNGEIQELKKLCTQLGIDEQVSFEGYTPNPHLVFQESIASFLTSKFEGFGLSVMESINNGCPVISYNIKYGSSELIDNNKNGILIEPNNINELAKGIEIASNQRMKHVKLNDRYCLKSAINNYKELLKDLKC
ncbi:glycosyltransferase [Mammaliicoccus sp. Dog046]|uniref:glycosyltransferase n=1 Tax=Mammaliicoccus sp. Dog046 TaxID=3034233 RepID=UPI002B257ED0|nr:glycosyltransferase [Mammaliicoccus sp. Dog046]WQK84603.1 glycosyltransferase [Mammaliicoccus sp. Dog046]